MQPLDLYVEDEARVELDALMLFDDGAELLFFFSSLIALKRSMVASSICPFSSASRSRS